MIIFIILAAMLAFAGIAVNHYHGIADHPPLRSVPEANMAGHPSARRDDAIDTDLTTPAWTALDELQLNRLLKSHRDQSDSL